MIRFIRGDIFESEAEAIVNTVNTVGVMGKGLALQFKERYPENYKIYRKACKEGNLKVGQMLVTECKTETGRDLTIINFPTKADWRRPSEYSFIEEGLKSLKAEIERRGIGSVAIPRLGSKNGGLNWNIVREMIVNTLQDMTCEVMIYDPTDAIEERMSKERAKLTPARTMLLDVMGDLVAHGEFISEFAAEKIAYFLQRLGAKEEFGLSFSKGYYGPYSGKVKYVLHYLNGSYLMGMSDRTKHPFDELWLQPEARTAVDDEWLKPENIKYKEIAERTKVFLRRFYSNFSLELLSTVDYLLENDPQLKGWRQKSNNELLHVIKKDLSMWSNRKERLFDNDDVITLVVEHLRGGLA